MFEYLIMSPSFQEIDIKKQGSTSSYAFIQYSEICAVTKAMRKLDGEHIGSNRINLGFGKSMPTNCVWLDGLSDTVTEKFLSRQLSRFGPVTYTVIDKQLLRALVFFEATEYAQAAVPELKGRSCNTKKVQVSSHKCFTNGINYEWCKHFINDGYIFHYFRQKMPSMKFWTNVEWRFVITVCMWPLVNSKMFLMFNPMPSVPLIIMLLSPMLLELMVMWSNWPGSQS